MYMFRFGFIQLKMSLFIEIGEYRFSFCKGLGVFVLIFRCKFFKELIKIVLRFL